MNNFDVEATLNPKRLSHILFRNATNNEEFVAWHDTENNERVTNGDLLRWANIAIEYLSARKLKPGQTVCFVLTKSGFFFPVLLACIELGLILVPVEEDMKEVKSTIHALRSKLLLYGPGFTLEKKGLPSYTDAISIHEFMKKEKTLFINKDFSYGEPDLCYDLRNSPSLLIKTSGTTGQAKFVELSEKNLAWDCYGLQKRFQLDSDDCILCTLPWSHMNAIMMTGCLPLVASASVVYKNITRFPDPISAIQETRCNIASLTPTLLAFLLKRREEGQCLDFLKFAFCGAAPLLANLWEKAEKTLQCKIYQGYGLSETTCWITASESGEKSRYSNVGTPLVGKIRIDENQDIPFVTQFDSPADSSKKIGEIHYKGPILMNGYRFLDGNRQIKLTCDGYFATGDIGYIDETQNLKIIGRMKEIIIRSGINVVPEMIDSIVRSHPNVIDSKTVGIPDDLLGEQIITAYVLEQEANTKEIEVRRFTSENLPKHFIPNKFVRVANLPKNRVGKIALGDLRRIVNGELAQESFDAINTWKFKRAHPDEPEKIVKLFQNQILMSKPIKFIAYWGVGQKISATKTDINAMERFKELLDVIKLNYNIGADLKLLLTDTHAILNGKPHERIEKYLSEIEALCDGLGFSSIRTSNLWEKYDLDIADISKRVGTISLSSFLKIHNISLDVVNKLISSATKHVECGDIEEGLKRYLIACISEREYFAEEFMDSVFLTYNDFEMNFLTPALPTFSIYSYQKGIAVKPWFAEK